MMKGITFDSAIFPKRKIGIITLFLVWLLGILVGISIFRLQRTVFASMMLSASCATVSIVSLSSIVILPFSVTAIAVVFSKPYILFALCFMKSALYSLSVISIYSVYSSAGWLAQWVLLFLDNCSTVALWMLWINSFTTEKTRLMKALALCCSVCTIFWVLDCHIVSRFAVSVFSR